MIDFTNKIITLNKKRTCLRMANVEWEAINIICTRENIKKNLLLELINQYKDPQLGLTCSARLFSTIYLYRLFFDKNEKYYTVSKMKPSTAIFEAIKSIL